MQVRFWGTRGSIAKPGPSTARYGGNTSCVEIRSNAGTLIVVDAGTGAHALGQQLIAAKKEVHGHLLISHTHWDHIQGIPFFAPLFIPGNNWDIHGPKGLSEGLRAILAGQMEHTYFPIALDQFAASVRYHDLVEGSFRIGDVEISTRYLNHPALTLGYRFEADGASLVYCCDHEPHSAALASGESAIAGVDLRHTDFIAGADLVIHDAQYTAAEYPAKKGWGHSPVEYAVRACRDSGVKKLALTHHDPLRGDDAVDQILLGVRAGLKAAGSPLEVIAAAEGLSLDVTGDSGTLVSPSKAGFLARTPLDVSSTAHPVFLYVSSSATSATLSKAIALEGLPCSVFGDADELLRRARMEQPSLVIIEHSPPKIDGERVARAIREASGDDAVQVPLVLVAASTRPAETPEGVATDWLVEPFTLSYARTKIRAWVLRSACRWVRANSPGNEPQRLRDLQSLAILDTPPEARFDRVTRIASAALNMPIALVSLVDKDRQWFKSCYGLAARETPRDAALCAHVVHQREEMVVPDTLLDDRFADNPLVVGEPRIRFYAGAPLLLENGSCIGTLCVIDTRPRQMSKTDLGTLRDLRDMVLEEIQRGPSAAGFVGAALPD